MKYPDIFVSLHTPQGRREYRVPKRPGSEDKAEIK